MNSPALLCALVAVIQRSLCLPCHVGALLLQWALGFCRRRRAPPGHVCITGAASGMGRGLALYYAAQKHTRCLSLTDVNAVGLEETRAACLSVARAGKGRPTGADLIVAVTTVDVTDAKAMRVFIESSDAPPLPSLDLVLCVAGVIETRVGGGRALDDLELGLRSLVAVNVLGTANTVLPALDRMRQRGRGQIGVLGSLAALDGLNALYPAYAASKAFVTAWTLGLRARLDGSGVTLNVFAPGAVATPLLAAPPGVDSRYDPTTFAPSWIVHAPCIEMSVEHAAASWATGLARDEALTLPHRFFSLLCADPCLDCPLDARDCLVRGRCYMLWGWRPPVNPQHAWLGDSREEPLLPVLGPSSSCPVIGEICDALAGPGNGAPKTQ